MYAPGAYAQDDPDALCRLIADHPLATLCRNGPAGPLLAYAPLVAERAGGAVTALVGHIARANPFWRGADGADVVAMFAGPDGYVSPGFYPSKREHGRVVPTWNYQRVEIRGRIALETEPARLRSHVDAPTVMMESSRPAPWSVADAPGDYTAGLLRAIVGLRIEVTSAAGSWKLGQGKSDADRAGVIDGLLADGAAAIAEAMRRV
jgi:transcriptional regulator